MNANEFLPLAQSLAKLLLPVKKYWQTEAMELPAEELDQWGDESLRHFFCFDLEAQKKWETTRNLSLLPNGPTKETIDHLNQLLQIKHRPNQAAVTEIQSSFNPLRIKEKKLTELSEIMAYLKAHDSHFSKNQFWEIGGGKGHLGYALATLTQNEVVSIDRNSEFQQLGLERIKRYLPVNGPAQVRFICQNLTPELGDLPQQLKSNNFLLGLHTCGPLALFMTELFTQSEARGMLNIPCCYYHLNHLTQVNLSSYFKNTTFPWNQESLTLATHAHTPLKIKDYDFKNRVKLYRFSLHNFLSIELGIKERVTFGTSMRKLYEKSFSEYALHNLKKIKLPHHFGAEHLDNFFNHPENQINIKKRIGMQAYRNIWGRGLEYVLILDRALSLVDQGHEVLINAFFEEGQSPRNLGILATKSKAGEY